MPPMRPYPSAATASTAASRSPTSKDTLRRPSSLAIAGGDPGTWSGVTKLASSSRDPPSGGRSIAISQCAPGMPHTVSTNSPSTDPVPSTSRPSPTKNAVTESRSATVMPTWSKRRTCAMRSILQVLSCRFDAGTEPGQGSRHVLAAQRSRSTQNLERPCGKDVLLSRAHDDVNSAEAPTLRRCRHVQNSRTANRRRTRTPCPRAGFRLDLLSARVRTRGAYEAAASLSPDRRHFRGGRSCPSGRRTQHVPVSRSGPHISSGGLQSARNARPS